MLGVQHRGTRSLHNISDEQPTTASTAEVLLWLICLHSLCTLESQKKSVPTLIEFLLYPVAPPRYDGSPSKIT